MAEITVLGQGRACEAGVVGDTTDRDGKDFERGPRFVVLGADASSLRIMQYFWDEFTASQRAVLPVRHQRPEGVVLGKLSRGVDSPGRAPPALQGDLGDQGDQRSFPAERPSAPVLAR